MILEHYVLDTATLLALGGSKQVSGLIHLAAGDPVVRLWVPITCALEAERERTGIVDYLGILDVLHTLDTDYAAAHTIAALHQRHVSYGVAAAVHAARPTLDRPEGALVATVAPQPYEALEVPVFNLNA
ncbi:hypothetical protein GCM10010277_85730 [Streptomyces longisporoflavus]|uniref:hypothetical protein n=1 Tax=Streptomyces longisporoflavus TaxID=28044 RepID=UPI00167E1216|nr:hypothetical protein [Streptomyces longisporoflavus]GGV72622.1 hypothetical protein GCM10010277_85730 [Streptomyces longisporoflavus]